MQAMFVANIFLWIGLFLIAFINTTTLIEQGPEPVLLYNHNSYILCMGAVVVCFEGIGLVLPLRDSLDHHLQVLHEIGFVFGVVLCNCVYMMLNETVLDAVRISGLQNMYFY